MQRLNKTTQENALQALENADWKLKFELQAGDIMRVRPSAGLGERIKCAAAVATAATELAQRLDSYPAHCRGAKLALQADQKTDVHADTPRLLSQAEYNAVVSVPQPPSFV